MVLKWHEVSDCMFQMREAGKRAISDGGQPSWRYDQCSVADADDDLRHTYMYDSDNSLYTHNCCLLLLPWLTTAAFEEWADWVRSELDELQSLDRDAYKGVPGILQERIGHFLKGAEQGNLGTEVPQWGPGAKPRSGVWGLGTTSPRSRSKNVKIGAIFDVFQYNI